MRLGSVPVKVRLMMGLVLPLLMTASFVLDVFDGADAGELGQRKFLTRISQDLIDFEGGLIVDFQRYADLAFDDAFCQAG